MKYLLVALLLTLGGASAMRAQSSLNFELVESTPIGTTLDNADIRDTRDVWIEMIGGAKRTLDIEQFYVSDKKGEQLEGVIAAIEAAAARGVNVRLIADARMHRTYPDPVDRLGTVKNIAVRIIDFGKLAGGVQHAKYFLVDGEQAYIGSQNFDWRALNHIHELGFRVRESRAVGVYQEIFDLDWALAGANDKAAIPGALQRKHYDVPFTVVNPPGDTVVFSPTMSPIGLITDSLLWDETAIVRLIDGAEKEVRCQVLTYSPVGRDKSYYAALDNALRRAAVRGVKVEMIVADWSKDHPTVDYLKSLALVPNIGVKFSEIPEWSGGYVPFGRVEHCKYLVVDSSACWIGTSNWEKSYFTTTRNLGVVVTHGRIIGRLKQIFDKGWNGPYTSTVRPEATYTPRKHGE